MKKFITTVYTIESSKIKKDGFTFVMISDLHNVMQGEDEKRVIKTIKEAAPDGILIAGDLVLGKPGEPLFPAQQILEDLVKIAPVYYAPGNHEHRMKLFPEVYRDVFKAYEENIKALGVRYLENETCRIAVRDNVVDICGLMLPYHVYDKRKRHHVDAADIKKLLGRKDKGVFQIMLAHTPRFARAYFDWGADLTLCGHYHGGMVRLPFLNGVISPDFVPFPKYCHGIYEETGKYLITGAGLGEHTIPFRMNNPREVVVIKCMPKNAIDF